MRNKVFVVWTGMALMMAWEAVSAAPYVLYSWVIRSGGGTLSSLVFKSGAAQGCPTSPPYLQPCYNPTNTWTSNNGVASTVQTEGQPTWDWTSPTLTMTGLLWATSFINSNPNGQAPVISDKVRDLVINTGADTTDADEYFCVEGFFLATVQAHGCKNTHFGANFADDSTGAWTVGNARCVTLTIGGDDYSLQDGSPGVPGTPLPRGVTPQAAGQAGVGCAQTSGAFVQWNVVRDDGQVLILSDVPAIGNCILFGAGAGPDAGPNPGQFGPACGVDMAFAGASYLILVASGATDTDGDGVVNSIDNCRTVANPIQWDANADGYGNICDPDLNNSGLTTASDYTILRSNLNTNNNPHADLNGSGLVTDTDYTILRNRLNTAPGPSGLCAASPVVPCTTP